MSEGREVLGYTLIRRRMGTLSKYWIGARGARLMNLRWTDQRGRWTAIPEDACCEASVPDLLTQAAEEGALRWVAGDSYHIGRVVRIPGEQKVEVLTEPEKGCEWGVRGSWRAPGPWVGHDGWTGNKDPVPMTLEEAQTARDKVGFSKVHALYMTPLRVTNSEPRTVVEEVECE